MDTQYVKSVSAMLASFERWLSTVASIEAIDIEKSFAKIDQGKKLYYECLDVTNADALGYVGHSDGIVLSVAVLLVTSGSPEERVARIVPLYEDLVKRRTYGMGDGTSRRGMMLELGLTPRPAILINLPLILEEPKPEAKLVTEPLIIVKADNFQ